SIFFFFSSRRRHTRSKRDWSSDVCSSDLQTYGTQGGPRPADHRRQSRAGSLSNPGAPGRPELPTRHLMTAVDQEATRRGLGRGRSEERRVGKECRARWSAEHEKKKRDRDD